MSKLADEIVEAAAREWLAETEDLPGSATEASDADILRMSAAWLDFYDATWPIVAAQTRHSESFSEPDRDGLQRSLRALAQKMENGQ